MNSIQSTTISILLIIFFHHFQAPADQPLVAPDSSKEVIVHVGPLSPTTGLSQNEISFEHQVQRKSKGEFIRISFTKPQPVQAIKLQALSTLKKAGIQIYGAFLRLSSGDQVSVDDLDYVSTTNSLAQEKKGYAFIAAGENRSYYFPFLYVNEVTIHVEGWSSNDISMQLFVQVARGESLNAWQEFQAFRENSLSGSRKITNSKDARDEREMNYSSICIQNQLMWKSRLTAEELVNCDLINSPLTAACVKNQSTDFGRTPDANEILACSKVTTENQLIAIREQNEDYEDRAIRPDAEIISVIVEMVR